MNPLHLCELVESRYKRYLRTTFYFRDPVLRQSFEAALDSERLSKGPFLEGTPIFKKGKTPEELLRDLFGNRVERAFLDALKGDRPLYVHQEEAITRVNAMQNVVVATGTGSGKTEAFLYPILLHLYREYLEGSLGPGVRALVLYPMNALANDQRDRLGELCRVLHEAGAGFRFTFGQYTGDTPEDPWDKHRQGQRAGERRLHGELVYREEMRKTPPHILLTNYSMLEYLLIRPLDSELFDNGRASHWRFIVIDEAHQYKGSKGTEMALLIRRLKHRLRAGGRKAPFTCIATSATMMRGERDKAAVSRFAQDLFGEPFSEDGVILGEVVPVPEASTVSLGLEEYQIVSRALSQKEQESDTAIFELARRLGIACHAQDTHKTVAARILKTDNKAVLLRRLITKNPSEARELALQLFPGAAESEQILHLSSLVEMLAKAKDPAMGTPLLSVRYHLFLSGLEGAFISLDPPAVYVHRKALENDRPVYEVALCRECGQHYIVGQLRGNRIVEASRDPGGEDYGVRFFKPIESEADISDHAQLYTLCLECGWVRAGRAAPCAHGNTVILELQEQDEEEPDRIRACSTCGYTGRDPAREVVYGTDGPHAVVATALVQNLPADRMLSCEIDVTPFFNLFGSAGSPDCASLAGCMAR
ncbi:MAG: DEAD/DEAH box helicase [Bacillota bacterium]